MNLSLPPRIAKLIEERVNSGKYPSAEDVVAAAVVTLDQQEQFGDFEPGELDRLLEAGENSGPALDGDEVMAEFRALRANAKP